MCGIAKRYQMTSIQKTDPVTTMKGKVEIVKVHIKNLTNYTENGQVCGSSINPQNIVKQIEDDHLSGTLYYAITDDMKKRGEILKTQGTYPLNGKYSKTEEGPGFAFIFCSDLDK